MNQSLGEILDVFKAVDSDLAPENFDPATLVGDLKGKVDSIKWRIDTWNKEREAITDWILMLNDKDRSLEAKIDKLKDYVVFEMERNNFTTLPGTIVRCDLRESPESITVNLAPSSVVYERFRKYMHMDTKYSWDKQALKDLYHGRLENDVNDSVLQFVEVKRDKHIRFFAKKGV